MDAVADPPPARPQAPGGSSRVRGIAGGFRRFSRSGLDAELVAATELAGRDGNDRGGVEEPALVAKLDAGSDLQDLVVVQVDVVQVATDSGGSRLARHQVNLGVQHLGEPTERRLGRVRQAALNPADVALIEATAFRQLNLRPSTRETQREDVGREGGAAMKDLGLRSTLGRHAPATRRNDF